MQAIHDPTATIATTTTATTITTATTTTTTAATLDKYEFQTLDKK